MTGEQTNTLSFFHHKYLEMFTFSQKIGIRQKKVITETQDRVWDLTKK